MPLVESANFNDVIADGVRVSGYPQEQLLHDYWMVRCLYGIAQRLPADARMRRTPGPKAARKGLTHADMPEVGRWAFAGGTSLTAAWQIVERFSEDIDGNLFRASDDVSRNSLRTARRAIGAWGTRETRAHRTSVGTGNVRISKLAVPGGPTFSMDTVLHGPDPAETLTTRRRIRSIIARHLPDLTDQHPELGGFELPVVVVPFTATNKLDALHRRAADNDYVGLSLRARDVYDLGAIARSEHADETRHRVPELVSRMTAGQGHQEPRPDNGYGSADLYRRGSNAYETLREAYHSPYMSAILPAEAVLPDFDQTMNDISELDLG